MPRLRRIRAVLLAGGLFTLAFSAPQASAATFGCEASAVRGTLLGTTTIEPVVANRGAAACETVTAGLDTPLPVLLSAGAVTAKTTFTGPTGAQAAGASGGLADLRVLALPQLPITLPTAQISDTLGSVTVPLTGLLSTLLGGLVNVSIDLRPALQALGAASHGAAYFAHEQTAGKGQRGKSWTTNAGENLILSVIIEPTGARVGRRISFIGNNRQRLL